MTNGSISKWEKKVGDKVGAGDSLAQLETDKASISFDAQDDFYIAKLLVEEGQEIAVGAPIMITVEEASSVSAFANYVHIATAAVPKVEAPKPVPVPVVEAPKPVVAAAPTPAPVVPTADVVSPPVPKPAPVATSPAASQIPWGTAVKSSPLLFKLAQTQSDYVAKYGFTGHVPLEVKKKADKKEKKA